MANLVPEEENSSMLPKSALEPVRLPTDIWWHKCAAAIEFLKLNASTREFLESMKRACRFYSHLGYPTEKQKYWISYYYDKALAAYMQADDIPNERVA